MKREWSLVVAVILMALLVTLQSARRKRERGHDARDDAFYQRILAKPNNQDVAEWRKSGQPVLLGEQTRETSAAILDELFAAGAVRIVATDVEKDPGFGLATNWIVIELPRDAASRPRMFALLQRLSDKNGWDEQVRDDGGRYTLMGKFKLTFRWP
jgi:hypothetical protein